MKQVENEVIFGVYAPGFENEVGPPVPQKNVKYTIRAPIRASQTPVATPAAAPGLRPPTLENSNKFYFNSIDILLTFSLRGDSRRFRKRRPRCSSIFRLFRTRTE